MGGLWSSIRQAVAEQRYYIGVHTDNQLGDRGVDAWHVAAEIGTARLRAERPTSKPNPTVIVRQALPNGEDVDLVWAWSPEHRVAKLVTVWVPD